MKSRFALILLCTALAAGSCAVKEETTANEDAKMYLEAWIQTHHPDARKQGMGIYVIDEDIVEGDKTVDVPCYAMVTYTVTDLEWNVSSTSDSTVAKQIGTYGKPNYYGPVVWTAAWGNMYKGVEDMIDGMTVGSSRTAVIPGWLQTYNRFDTEEEYMKEVTDNSPIIYKVRIEDTTDDIIQWQIDSMKRYSAEHLGGIDTLDYGVYYKRLAEPENDKEDFRKDTTIFINYTGMLLNGQAFDTTLERVAKDNNIFDSSKTYGPVEVQMSSDSLSIQLDGNDIIEGLAKTPWQMHPTEKGLGMFYSSPGYGYSGSGALIPGYAPLIFEIEVVADPDAEEEDEEE